MLNDCDSLSAESFISLTKPSEKKANKTSTAGSNDEMNEPGYLKFVLASECYFSPEQNYTLKSYNIDLTSHPLKLLNPSTATHLLTPSGARQMLTCCSEPHSHVRNLKA